mmetsp:Transcript_33950/g.33102  ORF Transcript_33950/g.33102 Transcript_33950/m.33102 type:complete len:111 (+) Transcript_33950:1118-1450(+)
MWLEHKNSQDESGFTFKQVIYPGCKYPNSKIGVVAGSAHSYKTFEALFNEIIAQWHQFTSNHTQNMNLSPLTFSEEEQALIKERRISVVRNFADYSFNPHLSRDQRNELE